MSPILAQVGGAAPPQPLPHPELPPLTPLPPVLDVVLILGYACAGLLLLLGFVLWWRRRPRSRARLLNRDPRQEALEHLRALLQRAEVQSPAATAAEVSACLRRYLWARHGIPAPFRTSEELFGSAEREAAVQVPRGLVSAQLREFQAFANLWDRLAYAPDPANERNAVELVKQVLQTLEQQS